MKYKYNTNKRVSCILYNLQCCIYLHANSNGNIDGKQKTEPEPTELKWQQMLVVSLVGCLVVWLFACLAVSLAGRFNNLSATHLAKLGPHKLSSTTTSHENVCKCAVKICRALH